MEYSMDTENQAAATTQEDFMRQLSQTFEKLPFDIPVYMFMRQGEDNVFTQTNRQIIRAFRELSSKVTFREYFLDHELAQKWNVDRSPSLLIAPERVNIRWLGAPLGEEGRILLETFILVGMGIVAVIFGQTTAVCNFKRDSERGSDPLFCSRESRK